MIKIKHQRKKIKKEKTNKSRSKNQIRVQIKRIRKRNSKSKIRKIKRTRSKRKTRKIKKTRRRVRTRRSKTTPKARMYLCAEKEAINSCKPSIRFIILKIRLKLQLNSSYNSIKLKPKDCFSVIRDMIPKNRKPFKNSYSSFKSRNKNVIRNYKSSRKRNKKSKRASKSQNKLKCS